MKKLILAIAVVLGSFTAIAQTSAVEKTEKIAQTTAENFTEIKADEVPEVVKTALKKAYPESVLDKAFINEKKEYKLEITVGDKVGVLYADAAGKWITK